MSNIWTLRLCGRAQKGTMANSTNDRPYVLRQSGGEADPNRLFNVPGVLLALVALNVLFFMAIVLVPGRAIQIVEFSAAVSPGRLLAGPGPNGGWLGLLSPLIAHMFVHASVAHLLFNMFMLLAFGAPITRRMGTENALQSSRAFAAASIFLTFYLLCGVAGALMYVAMHTNEFTLLVGASGGVSGLLGGLVRFAFNRSTLFGPENARISPLTAPSVISWTVIVILLNLGTAIFGGALAGGAQIAWEAHIGGYIFGLLTYPLFERLALAFK